MTNFILVRLGISHAAGFGMSGLSQEATHVVLIALFLAQTLRFTPRLLQRRLKGTPKLGGSCRGQRKYRSKLVETSLIGRQRVKEGKHSNLNLAFDSLSFSAMLFHQFPHLLLEAERPLSVTLPVQMKKVRLEKMTLTLRD